MVLLWVAKLVRKSGKCAKVVSGEDYGCRLDLNPDSIYPHVHSHSFLLLLSTARHFETCGDCSTSVPLPLPSSERTYSGIKRLQLFPISGGSTFVVVSSASIFSQSFVQEIQTHTFHHYPRQNLGDCLP